MTFHPSSLAIYQTESREISLQEDLKNETLLASQVDIFQSYGKNKKKPSFQNFSLFKNNGGCKVFCSYKRKQMGKMSGIS